MSIILTIKFCLRISPACIIQFSKSHSSLCPKTIFLGLETKVWFLTIFCFLKTESIF